MIPVVIDVVNMPGLCLVCVSWLLTQLGPRKAIALSPAQSA